MDVFISKPLLGLFAFCALVFVFVGMLLLFFWKARLRKKYSPFTEDSLRLPGYSLRNSRNNKIDDFVFMYIIYVGLAIILVLMVIFTNGVIRPILTLALVLAMAFVLVKSWKSIEIISSDGLGLEGEEYAGQELNFLMRSGAFVFHDIPYKYGNIDHIVVGRDKVFVVETKAWRKPQSEDGKGKEYKVVFNGVNLQFPGFSTDKPVQQAKRHAEFLTRALKAKGCAGFPVVAVVALPGWFVQSESNKTDVLVINPKRGKALRSKLGELDESDLRNRVASYIDSVARSVPHRSNKADPDAKKNYDFWLNPRVKDVSL